MKKYIIAGLIFIMINLSISINISAQSGLAGMPGSYLHMGIGAQALGMGKAYTAVANDATAIYWNPAGFSKQNNFQLYMMHSKLFLDTNFDYIAAIAPTQNFGNIGLGVIALSSSNFEQRSLLNEELGTFKMSDMAFLLSWSKEVYEGISIGLNYKFVSQKILNLSGTGHGIDLGIKKRLFEKFDIGFTAANLLSPKVTLVEEAQKFPTQFRFGVATSLLDNKLILSSDLAQVPGWGSTYFNFGVEYTVKNNMALRTGLENGAFTFGVGISFREYGLDYSSSKVSELGTNHRFAVKYSFGGFGVHAEANPKVFSPVGESNISRIKLHVKSRSEVSKWVFEIVDLQGRIIRQFNSDGFVPEEIIWDGRNNRGDLVNDGKFVYRFDVFTIDGVNMNAEGVLVKIDTQGPEGVLGFIEE